MEKISFKKKEEDRVVVVELEFDEESFVIKLVSPVAGAMQEDKTIADMLKSMLRTNENSEELFDKIINTIDNEDVTILITTALEKIQLKKKSTNS